MQPWPVWMDDAGLMAKSKAMGGETLAEHTRDVLHRLCDVMKLQRGLENIVGERLWERMYWGCFLHDFGKAAIQFQERLNGEKNEWAEYGQRHEVLSLGFVDWLFPKGHIDRDWVIAVIACHHKDSDRLFDSYGGRHPVGEEAADVRESAMTLLPHLALQITQETRWHLWRWLDECGTVWAETLNVELHNPPDLIPFEQASQTNLERSIFQALRDLARMRDTLSSESKFIAYLYRGLILTADHAASAGAGEFPPMRLTQEIASKPLPASDKWRSHQHDTAHSDEGSAIMIAPTGSGKTEAALLWAARQIEHRPAARLFYTLPYQASMNAMMERLCARFFQVDPNDNVDVTIQHSRATLKFYQDMMEADSGTNSKAATIAAKERKNLARLNYYPVQVFSPYQMLKAAYSLKGYEALLVDYTGGLFICDEIHAYEPSRLALIITMMGWLVRNYRARFMVMTATLPPTVEAVLRDALPDCQKIIADQQVFVESRRHTVHILDGGILDHLELINQDFATERSVLVCCNQVARAQEVYQRLKEEYGFSRDNMLLLHGRFNGKDRTDKERLLARVVGVRSTQRRPFVIVATQVVEVSLDIDLDTIYTEPAPLEALLQRFGRVNRGREIGAPLCPVHVFREPMGEKESRPYNLPLVKASLEVLERYCGGGKPIDESLVTIMLREIYEQESIAREWQAEYKGSAERFQDVLDRMKPYQSADLSTFREFYKLFDGTQVLPIDCETEYDDAREKGDFLDASQYLVNVSWGQYGQIKNKGLDKGREENEYADHVNVPYNEEWGLNIAEALVNTKDEDE